MCGDAKPLQIARRLTRYSKVSIGGHGGLREARLARASTVRGTGMQGEDWLARTRKK